MGSSITIRGVRFSYCHLFQPVKQNENATPKYSTTILLPKSNVQDKAAIDRAIEQAITEGLNKKWNGVKPPYIAIPIRDGDGVRESGEPFGAECKGCWVFTARSNQAPGVVDAQVQNIINPTEVYSGMYGNVNVNFYPYNFNGTKGIACGLNHVQKTHDGEPLGSSRVSAADAFQPDAQQDAASYGAPPQNSGYSAAPAQNGYGIAPGYGAPPANPGATYGGNPASNGYGNPASGYGAAPTQNGYGTAAGYGADPNAGYGNAPGYSAAPAQNGYGTAVGYAAYPNVDPNTGEVLDGGYAPTGMPVAGI